MGKNRVRVGKGI